MTKKVDCLFYVLKLIVSNGRVPGATVMTHNCKADGVMMLLTFVPYAHFKIPGSCPLSI